MKQCHSSEGKLSNHGVDRVQKPQSLMIWAALTETRFVPARVKINTKEYISSILEEGLVP
uniref:Uncharacterized protein n=1 Tax=Lepeophtheirus salmonis TaxID=72036 RepID=A0A0K2TFB9_LEPSM